MNSQLVSTSWIFGCCQRKKFRLAFQRVLERRIRRNDAMFAAMLAPYLSGLLGLQSDFGWLAGGVVGDYHFGLPQNLLVAQIAVTTRGV
jgi:hypothetical protein